MLFALGSWQEQVPILKWEFLQDSASPRGLLPALQMQVIANVYMSVPQTQDTRTAVNSSFAKVNHGCVLTSTIPVAHWESLENIDGICSSGSEFNKADW